MPVPKVKVNDACPEHGELLAYGCAHCAPIAARLSVVLRAIERAPDQRAISTEQQQRFATMLLVYTAGDVATSVAPRVVRRSIESLQRAARWWAAAEAAR